MGEISAFAGWTPPPGVDLVAVDAGAGRLTALRSPAHGSPRGLILLMPGYTASKEEFFAMAPALAQMGWETWAYSHRGQADSSAPRGVEEYRLERFVADALDVVTELRERGREAGVPGRPHLVGHSFGGVVAMATAAESPQSLGSLTTMCTGPGPVRGAWVIDAMLAAATVGGIGRWNAINPELAHLPPESMPESDAFRRARFAASSNDHLVGAAAILATVADLVPALSERGLPLHVLHGEHDDVWPVDQQREMAERLGARYTVIAGAGHSVQRDAPRATVLAIDEHLGGLSA
ncbi:lysophospholipase [Protaetiibacter sp. 10F1B-8-1]|uniref:Lysophospholipase n=2 Tax=Protaetiibacter mangrovi TaxID=2970926 RepID=A0ABT1ZGS5_9MICO|nr:lysophospholipase [Protaetiibacter mangrovi]